MKQTKNCRLGILIALLALGTTANAQLLKGTIEADSIKTVQMAYSLNGNVLDMQYQKVERAADGTFTFDMELPRQTFNVSMYVGNDIFGVHLEKGKTATILVKRNRESGRLEAVIGGDNREASNYYNAYVNAFDIMKYFAIDPSESKSNEEYRALLESEYAALKKLQPILKDEAQRDYYTRLSEGMYTWSKIRLIMDKATEENKKEKEYPEYTELTSRIDPNDPMSIATNLAIVWLASKQTVDADFSGDLAPYYLESIELVEKNITNPDVRAVLTNYIGQCFFNFGSANSDVSRFWERYKEFAKDYPQAIAAYEGKIAAIAKTAKGQELPYVPTMTRPDGTTCKLSDFYGKLIYIDIWATWCGPCCKEIPHLEKVAAHFKGNDRIHIFSISTDSNQKAWLKKLDTDKPEWPQFILSKEEQSAFMSAWAISGIPRFILISKDGKILSADAPRPSDESLIQLLEENM